MFNALVVKSLNRLLQQNPWACERLVTFAGQGVWIEIATISIKLLIDENGLCRLPSANTDSAELSVDLHIILTPGLLIRLAARDASVWDQITVTGNTSLAAVLRTIARDIRWEVEEDLSRVFGDIVAHRMTRSAHTLGRWVEEGTDQLLRSGSEYVTEEALVVASAYDIENFCANVDKLRDQLARLEKRTEALER